MKERGTVSSVIWFIVQSRKLNVDHCHYSVPIRPRYLRFQRKPEVKDQLGHLRGCGKKHQGS